MCVCLGLAPGALLFVAGAVCGAILGVLGICVVIAGRQTDLGRTA